VLIKYNRTLARRYQRKDTVDPIKLQEWLVGRMDGESFGELT